MLCPNMAPCLLVVIFLTTFALSQSDESVAGMDDGSSLPMLSGKRQHNIMRFGKRPSGGHNLIHFGKRGNDAPQHRFLYLGKREEEEESSPIFPFLQREDNLKRGHTIMRFGKRGPPQDMHNFIRFGKRDSVEEEEKRGTGGHSMMYFGKRAPAGHNMMYFGKRGSGHSMLYFGKRDDDYEPDMVLLPDEEAEEKRAAHSMIHFGKREDEDETSEESKRGSHSMIHFGKRPFLQEHEELNEMVPVFEDPESNEKRSLLRFGKKTEGSRARNSHAMIHFGKRSTEHNDPAAAANRTEEVVTRTKRDASLDSVESVLRYYYPRVPDVWDENSNSLEYENEPEKKDGSKNVFLRFG